MKLDFVAPTCPTEGIFVDPRIFFFPIPTPRELRWRWSRSSSNWPLISGWKKLDSFLHIPWKKSTPPKKQRITIWKCKTLFRLQPLEGKKGWVPLKSDIIIMNNHANLNSHSKLFLKWFVKIMIDFFKQKSLDPSKWLVFQKLRARRFGWAEELAPLPLVKLG